MSNPKISDDLSLPPPRRCIVTTNQIARCLALHPHRVDQLAALRHNVDMQCAEVAMSAAVEWLAVLESVLCRSNLPDITTEVARVREMLVAALESGAHLGKDGAS